MIGVMDCNNFFVSCERLFRPDLWSKPVAVLSSNDGVIVARSNELKAMGVPMGLPLFKAKQLVDFKDVTLFSSNFTLYRDISSRIMQILAEEVGKCEIYSVDEAFFTVSETITEMELIALRARIMQKTGIPVSIGVAKTKTLAKIAVEIEKKGSGVCILDKDRWQALATTYECGEVWNIGRQTAAKLNELGVKTTDQFMNLDKALVQKKFGIAGRRVQDELLGLVVYEVGDTSSVLRQSLTSSRSFSEPLKSKSELQSVISYHITELAAKLRERGWVAGRMHVMARASRYSDWSFQGLGEEVIFTEPTNTTHELVSAALRVIETNFNNEVPYKKAGVTLSNLYPLSYQQPSLFINDTKNVAHQTLDKVTDLINSRFGRGALHLGLVGNSGARTSAKLRSKEYTTRWGDIPTVQAK